ncbi:MAG: hypothetical protein ACTS5A_03705 [Candidatus Hodgkinia cicadicola]
MVSAAECFTSDASLFFYVLEELFNFFAASISRYQKLTECLQLADHGKNILMPERTTTTRWSCRNIAVKALVRRYEEIEETLSFICEDDEKTAKTHYDALGLRKKMPKLATGLFAVFCDDIL